MTIREIGAELLELMEMMEDPDMDKQVVEDTIEAVRGEFLEKAESYAVVHFELKAEAEKLKKEIDRLTARKRTIEANDAHLIEVIEDVMKATGNTDIKTDLYKIKLQKNPPKAVLDVSDIRLVPEKWLRYKEPEAKSADILAALKKGDEEAMAIAHIEQGESVRIR